MVCKLFGDCTDTHVTHQQGRRREVGGTMEERVVDRSSETAQQLVCVCAWLLSLYCNGRHMSVWQRRQKKSYRATEAGSDIPVFGRWNEVSTEKTDL